MKKVILGLVAITALISCKKDDDNGNDTTIQEGTFPKEVTYKDENGKVTSKSVQLIEGGKILSFEVEIYNENGTPIRTHKDIITYEGNLIKKIETTGTGDDPNYNFYTETFSYDGTKLVKSVTDYKKVVKTITTNYSYDGDKLTNMVKTEPIQTTENGQRVEGTQYTETNFTYNGDRITVKEKTYTKKPSGLTTDENTSFKIYTVVGGNVVKKETTGVSYKETIEYTYDTKNNPMVSNLTKIILPDYFIEKSRGRNNLLTATITQVRNNQTFVSKEYYEYVYNGKDYPTSEKHFIEENEQKKPAGSTEYKY